MMKRKISILLILVLFISLMSMPLLQTMAEGVTSASFTDGTIWKISDGATVEGASWGSVTGSKGSVTVSHPNLPYRSVFAKITGFEAGAQYKLSFKIPTTGIEHATIVLDDTANFKNQILYGNNGQIRINSGNCSTFSSGTAATTFTATNDFIYLAVKVGGGVTSITLNNFSIEKENSGNDDNESSTDGAVWKLSNGVTMDGLSGASFTGSNGTVIISHSNMAYRSAFAKIEGLTSGTTYDLSLKIPTTGIEHVTIVLDDTAYFKNHILYGENGQTRINSANCSTFTSGKATKTFTATNDFIYIAVKFGAGVTSATFNDFSIEKKNDVSVGNDAGNAIADGTWKAFNPHQTPDVTVDKQKHTVSTTNTYRSIFTKFTAEANSRYSLSFTYSFTGTYSNGITNAQVLTSNGSEPVYIPASGALDVDKNNICSSYQNNVSTKTVTLDFVTSEKTEYYLSVQTGGFTTLTLSEFALEKVATLSAKEAGGCHVVLGRWTAKSSNIAIASKDVATRTIKASNTNYHWVIGKIGGLSVGETYILTFKDDLSASDTIFALPADEDAMSATDYVIDSNGQYQGRYYKNKNTFSTVIKNSSTKEITIVFTATMENYHIFIHHTTATSAVYSNFTFEKLSGLEAQKTTVSNSPKGLKFAFKISKELQEKFAGLNVKEYGTISAVYDKLSGEQLVYNNYEAVGLAKITKQIAYSKVENVNNISTEEANGDKIFTTIITGIPSGNDDLEFAVRPYIVLDNNTIVYSGTMISSLDTAK